MDTEANAATEAENKPVYVMFRLAKKHCTANRRTHENKDAIGILLPAISNFVVFFLCHLHIHVEEGP
jgi:hypothetical protein